MLATSPALKIISVGIERTPNSAASSGFSSILSLATLTLPLSSVAMSSSAGAIILHGPHHSAQKSTTTGSLESSTSALKLLRSTLTVAIAKNPFGELRCAICGALASGLQAALVSRSHESGKRVIHRHARQRDQPRCFCEQQSGLNATVRIERGEQRAVERELHDIDVGQL